MAFTVTVTPFQLSATERWTSAKFNQGFNPTIVVTGSLEGLSNWNTVTATTKAFVTQDLAGDILRVAAGHGASTGQRVTVSSATTLPAGLSTSYTYYLRPDTTNPTTDFTLHYTLDGATNNTDRVDVSDAGTGVHTLTYYVYATGSSLIYNSSTSKWENGIVSPSSLPEYGGNTANTPGTPGVVPGAPPTTGDNYYFTPRGAWAQFPSPSDVGNNLYLNENVY